MDGSGGRLTTSGAPARMATAPPSGGAATPSRSIDAQAALNAAMLPAGAVEAVPLVPGTTQSNALAAQLQTVARVIDMETEGRGIRTTVVRVGPTLTEFADGWAPGTFEHLIDLWPRFGIQRHFNTMEPTDIANVVVHALTAPAHARVDTIEMQPVAPPPP